MNPVKSLAFSSCHVTLWSDPGLLFFCANLGHTVQMLNFSEENHSCTQAEGLWSHIGMKTVGNARTLSIVALKDCVCVLAAPSGIQNIFQDFDT